MRILHVDKFLYRKGGAPGYMIDLGALQQSAGHAVDFFSMSDPIRNLPSKFAPHFPPYIGLDPPAPGLLRRIKTFGRMLWSIDAARGMARTVDIFKPDVVHLHTIYHQLSPSILAPLARRKIPAVMTLHDYKLVCPTYARLDHGTPCDACITGTLFQAVIRRCKNDSRLASAALAFETALHRLLKAYDPVNIFICPSRFMHHSMSQAGIFTERLRHIPHFFDSKSLPSRMGAGDGIVAAGRLSMEKGFDLLIDAMGQLPSERLTIVGDGPLETQLRHQAERIAPGRITFTGRLERDHVLQRLRVARVVAIPSRWYENQPLAVIEAMGCGVAPVVTTLGGAPELVSHGIDGWIAAPSPESLAEALLVPLTNPTLAIEMGHAARKRIERDFDPALHLTRVFDAYSAAGALTNG